MFKSFIFSFWPLPVWIIGIVLVLITACRLAYNHWKGKEFATDGYVQRTPESMRDEEAIVLFIIGAIIFSIVYYLAWGVIALCLKFG